MTTGFCWQSYTDISVVAVVSQAVLWAGGQIAAETSEDMGNRGKAFDHGAPGERVAKTRQRLQTAEHEEPAPKGRVTSQRAIPSRASTRWGGSRGEKSTDRQQTRSK